MPTLDKYRYPAAPVRDMANAIVAAFDTAQDIATPPKKLNVSAKLGLDAVFDSVLTGKNLSDTACPCVRVMWRVEDYIAAAGSHCMVMMRVVFEYYFIIYVGRGQAAPSNFQELRDDYIRWNLEHLSKKGTIPGYSNIGITFPTNKWNFEAGRDVSVDFETPFKYFDPALLGAKGFVGLAEGYNVVRVDDYAIIHNHPS